MLADRREPKKLLRLLSDVAEVRELAVGDYLFFGRGDLSVLLERKTVGDFLSSLTTGRLYDQLRGITRFDVPILLLEGVYSRTKEGKVRLPGRELGFSYQAVENLLLDAQLRGIILARSPNIEASAMLIRGYYEYFTKEGHRFELRKQRFFTYSGKVTPALRLVCALPGVEVTTGYRLLAHFGCALNVFTAPLSELMRVRGIGREKAKKIYEALRR